MIRILPNTCPYCHTYSDRIKDGGHSGSEWGYMVCLLCGGIYIANRITFEVRFMTKAQIEQMRAFPYADAIKAMHDRVVARMIG